MTIEQLFSYAKALLDQYGLVVPLLAMAVIGVAVSFYRQIKGDR